MSLTTGFWSSVQKALSGPEKRALMEQVENLSRAGKWYHRIDLGNGVVTPGDRNQSLVYALYEDRLPASLDGLTVLDLGAQALGLSIEFAKRGALVTAVDVTPISVRQAEFVRDHFGLADRIEICQMDVFRLGEWLGRKFDIVAYLGLSYHLRHPQLALDLVSHFCQRYLLVSSQTIEGDSLTMSNRARHVKDRPLEVLYGWEPTERAFQSMVAHAGFRNVELVSTAPHAGESRGNICGNRSYYFAEAAEHPTPLPFLDSNFRGNP